MGQGSQLSEIFAINPDTRKFIHVVFSVYNKVTLQLFVTLWLAELTGLFPGRYKHYHESFCECVGRILINS